MQNLDFLPARYHEQSENRRSQVWRIGVIALFGGCILATAVFQFGLRRIAVTQLATVEASFEAAQAGQDRLGELNQQIAQSRAQVELYTYLNHPWPQTQLLAAIARPVTPSITLSEIQQMRDTPAASSTIRRSQARLGDREKKSAQAMAATPSQHDLNQLRAQCDQRPIVIHLTGLTTNAADLYTFIESLNADRLFAKAELSSLESLETDEARNVSRFRARVTLALGYGQPGGPVQPSQVMAGRSGELP